MRNRTAVGLLALGIAVPVLAGCNSSSINCSNGACNVKVSGKARVNLDAKATRGPHGQRRYRSNQHTFKVAGYAPGAVTLTSRGRSQTIRTGETKALYNMVIRVTSVTGKKARLRVQLM